ncbi:MAG: carboxypeptidase-like regulatory domain-containing protein, partial [Verrucomicrobia bacterium]|nr:carboxypeptidase-like regulatory domain-containing protein [Verrucomicrobiota bacterium]
EPLRAVSNQVEVEFRWPPNAANLPITFVPADLPVIVDIRGSVVDDETDAPVKDFWVQAGVVNPDRPGEMIWDQSYRGPILSGPPARFAVQAQRVGQNWRVLADGYVPQPILQHPVAESMSSVDSVMRLMRGGELQGTIVDASARPVPGARVLLTTEQTPDLTGGQPGNTFRGSTTTSDAAGHFRLRGVGGGGQTIFVVSPDGHQAVPMRNIILSQPLLMAARFC